MECRDILINITKSLIEEIYNMSNQDIFSLVSIEHISIIDTDGEYSRFNLHGRCATIDDNLIKNLLKEPSTIRAIIISYVMNNGESNYFTTHTIHGNNLVTYLCNFKLKNRNYVLNNIMKCK